MDSHVWLRLCPVAVVQPKEKPATCSYNCKCLCYLFAQNTLVGGDELIGIFIWVIKGWDQGILGSDGVPPMLAGGKLPPELGYGMRGAGCKGGSCIIPPDSALLFDVGFIGKA
ncbi:hypothetical protein L1049_012447 [Liquidambar formosana]|uniref:peptidylprolyl isomerase n=1 Tax=Liquidambar formosana TaxID=63359 RepID=A0AAP0N3N5_LIQFO